MKKPKYEIRKREVHFTTEGYDRDTFIHHTKPCYDVLRNGKVVEEGLPYYSYVVEYINLKTPKGRRINQKIRKLELAIRRLDKQRSKLCDKRLKLVVTLTAKLLE